MKITVSELWYYPVKSMRGLSLKEATLDDFGITGDRRFMLINQNGDFITQRKFPALALISATEDERAGLRIDVPDKPPIHIPLSAFNDARIVGVWSDQVDGLLCSEEYTRDLAEFIGIPLRMVYMPEATFRQVDPDFSRDARRVSFADGFPLLVTNEASLGDLNARLEHAVPMRRFRPNIVIKGAEPFAEDSWQQIRIGSTYFSMVKPCSRCVMTTLDDAGRAGKEPLRTLSRYRKNEFGVCFGQNVIHSSKGTISLGDEVEVLG